MKGFGYVLSEMLKKTQCSVAGITFHNAQAGDSYLRVWNSDESQRLIPYDSVHHIQIEGGVCTVQLWDRGVT